MTLIERTNQVTGIVSFMEARPGDAINTTCDPNWACTPIPAQLFVAALDEDEMSEPVGVVAERKFAADGRWSEVPRGTMDLRLEAGRHLLCMRALPSETHSEVGECVMNEFQEGELGGFFRHRAADLAILETTAPLQMTSERVGLVER